MVTRILHTGLLALWLIAGQLAWCQTTTKVAVGPDSTAPSIASTSEFVSPSLHKSDDGMRESTKLGISVGVTLGSIILVGSTTILCMLRRRNKALLKPQRSVPPGDGDFETGGVVTDEAFGKAKEESYQMTPPTAAKASRLLKSPVRFADQDGVYPTMPERAYAPQHPPNPTEIQQQQQYPQTMAYPDRNAEIINPYATAGNTYPEIEISNYSQQNAYAGSDQYQYQHEVQQLQQHPNNQQQPYQLPHHQQLQQHQNDQQQQQQPYQLSHHQQPRQEQQQPHQQPQGDHLNWVYPVSAGSASVSNPVSATSTSGTPEPHIQYLQDYQPKMQTSDPAPEVYHPPQQRSDRLVSHQDQQQPNVDLSTFLGYENDRNKYHVPPPHPNVSELPDQRKPVEMMGDGHFHEAP
ncbi:hypothetical protein GGS20DRAFT_262734 [Poronia punctata]|nr:hypothetical protein GGS20DRAFT_262734 [Poronia punctata]